MVQTPAESKPVYSAVALEQDDSRALMGYAYLQELASQANFCCSWVSQHADGLGVDVRLEIHEQLDSLARLTDFSLDFQLRTTARTLPVADSKLLFSLEVDRYEILRSAAPERPRFIVLLSLPVDCDAGHPISAEELVAYRSGRWLCLCGAPQAANAAATPVRFPTWNVLTPAALREIARRVSLGLRFFHEQ